MARKSESPTVLIAAGFEPRGRVGLLCDIATVRSCGGVPRALATTLTLQDKKFRSQKVHAAIFDAHLDEATEAAMDVWKLGVIADRRQLQRVASAFQRAQRRAEHFAESHSRRRSQAAGPWLVVDPVVQTSRGEKLSELRLADYFSLAFDRAIVTPNLPELFAMVGLPESSRQTAIASAAQLLLSGGFGAVVVKGGHARELGRDASATGTRQAAKDYVYSSERQVSLSGPRLAGKSSRRGTGCRFASALACSLGQGENVVEAARSAKEYVFAYLRGDGQI